MHRRDTIWFGALLALACVGCASVPNALPSDAGPVVAADTQAAGPPRPAYLLGPDDVLTIAVWREEGLTRQVRVRPDGRISFPFVGEVEAAGRTAADLQAEITRRLEALITAPSVTVVVDEVNSYKVYVLGEVERPGLLPVKGPVTVLQALAIAGGLKPFADGDSMVLVRRIGDRVYRVRLNYRDLVLGRNGAVNLTLDGGDTLVVP